MDGAGLELEHDVVDGEQVVRVFGELDAATERAFHGFLDGDAPAAGAVAIDLSGVAFIDSRGLATLLRTVETLRERGTAARLVNVGPQGMRLIDMTGLADHLLGPSTED